jgi:hypothetical protein
MAKVAPPGLTQIFDNDGNPAAGFLLYTYDAGTTTPRTTWSDSAETTPNLNPIVLDANGRAQIFWRGNYYIELRTAANVLIWSQDNFNIPSDAVGTSVVFDNGTAATPSVRFAQATSSGLFSPAANVVAMSINGVELMRWTGTNVGIGISAPAAKLHVGGTFRAAGAVTVDAGGITVTAGGITVTAGGLTVTAGGLTVTAGGATLNGNVSVAGGTFTSRGFVDNATTAAWNIDSAGRLRNNANTQLSFSARRTTTLGATGNIVFADVGFTGGHNRATMYNVATGEATIPTGQGGDYLVVFGGHATVNSAGASLTYELRVNGAAIHSRSLSGNDVGATNHIGISTVLANLSQSDVVTIFVSAISNVTIQAGANFAMRQLG